MDAVLVSLTEERSFALKQPSTFIGRDRWRVDIRLPDSAVEDVHCELIRLESGFQLINLSESGTLVNGEPASHVVIRDGDELTIASHRMRLFFSTVPVEVSDAILTDPAELSIEARWSALNMPVSDAESVPDSSAAPPLTGSEPGSRDTAAPEVTTSRTAIEPQFFVMLSGQETGPLPLPAIEQLALDYRITADTPVRAEETHHWSVAAGLNIDIPPPVQPDASGTGINDNSSDVPSASAPPNPAQQILASSAWTIISPLFYVSTCIRVLPALSPRTLVSGMAMFIALTAVLLFWYRGLTQTALTGTLTLNERPLAAVSVTFTGMVTGDSAVGFTDSNGRFSARTLDGELTPGRYHITLYQHDNPPAESGSKQTQRPAFPKKYASLGSSDAVIDIISDQTDYHISLTTMQSGAAFGTPP